jgi:Uma2 family endonuclease
MSTLVVDEQCVRIPKFVDDLRSFRRWIHSDEFPVIGRVCYLNGEVWVDLSREQIFSHNQVKGEFSFVLGTLIKAGRLGRFVPDGMLLSNVTANFSSQPDGTFVSVASLRTGRVRFPEGTADECIEMVGSPDMILEVLSTSSVEKDTVILRDLYWRAGIREYWLVDARGERLTFDILRHTPKGYVATRKQGGWVKSEVFGKSFKLTRQADELGDPEYTLSVR